MFRHLKCHPQGAHCALLKLHTDFGLDKKKLLKYKMINFNKISIKCCTVNILLKFIILYFNIFILPRPKSVRNFSKEQWAP